MSTVFESQNSTVSQRKSMGLDNPELEADNTGHKMQPPAFQLRASTVESAEVSHQPSSKGGLPDDIVSGFAASTGHDLGDVNVHYNSSSPGKMGALAYAQGNDIHLGAGQEKHLAHEAAHIVQQREGRVNPTGEVGGMPLNDSAALESEADSMGAKALQMKSNPATSNASASGKGSEGQAPSQMKKPVQRKVGINGPRVVQAKKVDTSGGSWDAPLYKTQDFKDGGNHFVGAEIKLEFEPNGLVEADEIGITQSVKNLKSTAADKTHRTEPSYASNRKKSISLTAAEGDLGRSIDQGDNSVVPNTNPLYAVENTAANVSKSLTDVKPVAADGFGEHGSRKKVGKKFVTKKGWIYDGPRRAIEFPGQQYEQTFEATALVLSGPLANTYLGSVEWGYSSDSKEKPSLKPLSVVRSGAPSSMFMKAAEKWNDAKFNQGGKDYDTVNLPLTTIESATKPPKKMTKDELVARYNVVDEALSKLDAAKLPNDLTNLSFEKKALEAEAARRKIVFKQKAQKP